MSEESGRVLAIWESQFTIALQGGRFEAIVNTSERLLTGERALSREERTRFLYWRSLAESDMGRHRQAYLDAAEAIAMLQEKHGGDASQFKFAALWDAYYALWQSVIGLLGAGEEFRQKTVSVEESRDLVLKVKTIDLLDSISEHLQSIARDMGDHFRIAQSSKLNTLLECTKDGNRVNELVGPLANSGDDGDLVMAIYLLTANSKTEDALKCINKLDASTLNGTQFALICICHAIELTELPEGRYKEAVDELEKALGALNPVSMLYGMALVLLCDVAGEAQDWKRVLLAANKLENWIATSPLDSDIVSYPPTYEFWHAALESRLPTGDRKKSALQVADDGEQPEGKELSFGSFGHKIKNIMRLTPRLFAHSARTSATVTSISSAETEARDACDAAVTALVQHRGRSSQIRSI